MTRRHLWILLAIIFVTGWALYSLYPPQNRDLIEVFMEKSVPSRYDAGWTNMLATLKKLQQQNPERTYGNLKEAVSTNDLTRYFPEIDIRGEKDPNNYILNQLQRAAAGKIKLGLDLQGGSSFLVEMQTNKLSETVSRDVAIANAVEVLRKRVDKYGVAEPLIQAIPGVNRILIQMPGLSGDVMDQVRKAIEKAAFLEFRFVHENSDDFLKQGVTPAGYQVLKESRTAQDGRKTVVPFLVSKERVKNLSGRNVVNAFPSRDNMNNPVIIFRFDSDGAKVFGDLTSTNIGRQLAIILDGELYSAPVIRSAIVGGSGEISGGSMTPEEANLLANVLQNPLEAPVQIIQERMVDPTLGSDTIRSGIWAAIIGTVAVAVFMALYYLGAGIVANVALVLNIVVLLGVMCAVGTTLTLPGIAGIVLTIGMAVDANVLIFERIREESETGKSLRGALNAGYSKAFGTIFDSNLTTLISSVILIYMGTGPVQGFGVALTIGLIVSMFTALVVTRLIFDFLLANNWIKSLPMLHLVRANKIDFMRLAKAAFVVSWVLILVGNGYGIFVRGRDVLGIEFAGGYEINLPFNQGSGIDKQVDKVRQAVDALGHGASQVQFQRDVMGGKESLRVTIRSTGKEKTGSSEDIGTIVKTALNKAFPNGGFGTPSVDRVGPTVGKEIQKTAIMAGLLALFGILVYVAFRYEFSFAVGAVIAIIHDILMTMGWYFLAGREMNATTVAALLTIIGFSINDTIVIFDRIREDLKLGIRGTFREVMNKALNQTLSRTIITSGTVFLATMALYLFGGGAINDFAFAFLVGIITGTYSSIYIASALVLWWHKGERPKIGAGAQTAMPDIATAPAKA